MRTTIKAYLSSNLGRIPPLTSELVALERLKKTSYNLVSTLAPSFLFGQWIFFILVMTCWLSGERSLHFGLLVFSISVYALNLTLFSERTTSGAIVRFSDNSSFA